MIHVVITVLSVSADTIQIVKLIQISNQIINLCICIKGKPDMLSLPFPDENP